MERRQFLAASVATSAFALSQGTLAQPVEKPGHEYYQIRRYHLRSGPQVALTEDYIDRALIPALSRMHMGPIGAFQLEYGPQTPEAFVLIPASSIQDLIDVDAQLAKDAQFLDAAASFWNASANAPAFERVEYSLLRAFEGWPELVLPKFANDSNKRIFQLRTYESPSHEAHVRKVEMFHKGEFEIFEKAGCRPIFFADTLIAQRMPSLTYMLTFSGMEQLEAGWDTFRNDPAWKKLSSSPQYSYEAIVSNISNLILTPLAASQI